MNLVEVCTIIVANTQFVYQKKIHYLNDIYLLSPSNAAKKFLA